MNRKVATIIILAVFVISLVVVSVIGTVGLDWSQNIIATEVYITDEFGSRLPTVDVNGRQMAQIEVELGPMQDTFTFYYTVLPDKADNKSVEFVIPEDMRSVISIVGSGGSAVINFLDGRMPENGFIVTVRCLDGSEKFVTVSFISKQVDSGETDI